MNLTKSLMMKFLRLELIANVRSRLWVGVFWIGALNGPVAAAAGDVPLPKQIYSVNSLFEEIRQPLKRKLDEVPKNYASKMAPAGNLVGDLSTHNQIQFFSEDDKECLLASGSLVVRAGGQLSQLDYTSVLSADKKSLNEVVRHFNCRRDGPLMTETASTQGDQVTSPEWDSVLSGARLVGLSANESSRFYQIADDRGEAVIRVVTRREQSIIRTDFSILGQRFLTMTEVMGPKQSFVDYDVYPYQVQAARRGNRLNSRSDKRMTLRVNVLANGQVNYFNGSSDSFNPESSVSFSEFQKKFQNVILSNGISTAVDILKFYVSELPSTEVVFAGVKSSRVLEEFNMARTRAESNDLLYVKDFLNQYIDYIDKGLIVITDKRP